MSRVASESHMFCRLAAKMPKLNAMSKPVMSATGKFMPRHLSMMALENDLPKLPVPALDDTMDKYLNAIRPLINDDDFENTQELVNEFRKKDGIGEILQEKLLEKAKKTDNWMAEWWDNIAYLDVRVPVVINYNPSCTFPKENFSDRFDFIRYSTRLIRTVLKFRQMIDSEQLSIDKMGNKPLNMYQYKLFLCGCRVPQLNREKYYVAAKGQAKHIVVAHRNQFYSVDVYDSKGQPLGESEIAAQLLKIVQNTEPEEPPVGVFTSENRDVWAKERYAMAKDRNNRANFEMIESSICILCLDKPCPPSTQVPSITECPSDSVTGRQTLHGDGIEYNSLNRWFDKPNQFTVSEDGHCGVCYEHTCAEAPTVGRMWEEIMKERKDYKSIEVKDRSDLPVPKKMKWNLKPSILQNMETAKDRLDSFVKDTDVRLFSYQGYGKNFIKSLKLSPDAWFQISLQLAFYRLHGHVAPAYETGSTRQFKLGRTDTIRSASIATHEFVRAMTSKHASRAERYELMRKAINYHSTYTKETLDGKAVDRHLLGLKLTAVESGITLPAIFMDPSYQYFFHFKLSTSQVPLEHESWVVFGPAVPDGYGICYNPQPNKLMYSVSTFNSNPATNPGHFAAAMQRSLDEMQLLGTISKI
ncbi:carnitine O-acetyltransferase isoform X2 [Nematostella vectensis]|uniref:carnitine O-acetyltransferase isoform X2 n=1 Tax=Nematostella vectensis TaxID=45351 RepID=UPI0020770276|nr:carnitine O-acetyltransferase isoform X2 [Nematostella vectensis]